MKILITGINGTIGAVLRSRLIAAGHEVIGWDRNQVPLDDYARMENFVRSAAPDAVYQLAIASQSTGRPNESWLVNYEWASELAWITRVLSIPFVFTSTAMVFSNDASGPFTVSSTPDASEGYGGEKRAAEQRVFAQNPAARVVRLGWQIGDAPGSNNMIDYLDRMQRESGVVRVSERWFPACSLLTDTADALMRLSAMSPGLYHLDSNRRWNFFQIVAALNEIRGRPWQVEATQDFVYDQRLLDERLNVPSLAERLPLTDFS